MRICISMVALFVLAPSVTSAETGPCTYSGTTYSVGSVITVRSNPGHALLVTVAMRAGGFTTRSTRERGTVTITATCVGIEIPSPGTPTPPPAPNADVGICGESNHVWHPQFVGDCNTTHEHGDPPPAWTSGAPLAPHFTHPGGTPSENALKHSAFKGFHATLSGVETYIVAHLDTHPNGQQTRFHSIQAWFRTTPVSHVTQWLDFGVGDNPLPNISSAENICSTAVFQRPVIQVNFPDCAGVNFENWYARTGPGWSFDIGFNVQPQFYGGPRQGTLSSGSLADLGTWLPTGLWNTTRRVELSWYRDRYLAAMTAAGRAPFEPFYATQFGQIVSGPDDPICGAPRTIGGRTYTTLCLPQFIADSMTQIDFANQPNAVQKSYPSTGLFLPN